MTPGPKPHLWASGPDVVEHAKYKTWSQMRNQAQWRGEPWNLTFEQYKRLWQEHWDRRGRERGCYCMTRQDVDLPWDATNTIVITREEHARLQSGRANAGYRSPARERWRQQQGKTDKKKSSSHELA